MKSIKLHAFLLIYLILTPGTQEAIPRLLQDPISRCGVSWEDANSKCGTPCPNGVDADCPEGEHCFGSVPCTSNDSGPIIEECGGPLECPLKACCSKWGHCGWTEEFCNDECQSNCELTVPSPPCDSSQRMTREVGYYASWATSRACVQIKPADLKAALYTHLIFAFAAVSENFELVPAQESDVPLYEEFVKLKEHNPNLKVMIAVGGWAFNDPPTQHRFSNMATTKESRAKFIESAVNFMGRYGFDGIDIDWEYPAAEDRGGRSEDFDNYAALLEEMHDAFKHTAQQFILTIAVPLSNWYLRHFDLERIHPVVDFMNVMAYDIHGVWDANIKDLGPYVRSHTNITEIEQSLNMFFKNGVPPAKLVLGTGAYGRSYTLSDPSCTEPGCAFYGPGRAGQCTEAPGTLAYFEILDILANNPAAKKVYDQASMSNYVYYEDQWISYDDSATFSERNKYAADKCLGGIMVWSVDMISSENTEAPFIELWKMETASEKQEQNGDGGKTAISKEKVLEAAKACYKGFFDNIPPSFCYKKGGDAGKIPTDCPDGYFRSLALCYKECDEGYRHIAGICYKECDEGYADHGLSCFKHIFKWYFKESYVPDSLTNFEVSCPEGEYLSGALCYRDCGKIGLENCGIGACAASGGECGASIAMMAIDFAIGLAEGIAFVLTLGASSASGGVFSAAKDKLKQTFQKMGKEALKQQVKKVHEVIKKKGAKKIIQEMTEAAVNHVGETLTNKVIEEICNDIGEQIIGQIKENDESGNDFELELQDFDPTGISGAVEECQETGTEEQNIKCAKGVLGAIDFVDPTGLCAMASAFLHPTCDV